MKTALTMLLGVILIGSALAEFNDFDCIPYTPGVYLQGYPTYSTANNWYDHDGESRDLGGTWSAFTFSFRPTYWGMMNEHRWMVSAAAPFASISPSIGDSESGIGDITFSAAYWFLDDHKNGSYFSVWFWSDIPVGDDEKGLGTGQLNLRPGVAYAMEKFPYQVQTSVYYNLRMKNSDTEQKPGDEIWANLAFGYGFNEYMVGGVDVETGWGQDWKLNDQTQSDTKENWLRVGPSFEYQFQPNASFKLKGLYNVMGKNTAQSFDIWARFNWGI
jgi:hypothetical protein